MFPKPNRLPHEVFRSVFKSGKRIHGDDILIIISPNKESCSRFAVQVGVKIDKRAVVRNRMKRLIRESIRNLLPGIKPGYDYIIIAQKNFSNKKEQDVEQIMHTLLSKLNIV